MTPLKYLLKLVIYIIFKIFNFYPTKSHLIVISHLFGKSFKFTEKSTSDRLIVIKYSLKILKLPVKPSEVLKSNKVLIFDNNPESKTNRIEFLSFYTKYKDYSFLNYSNLCHYNSNLEKFIFNILSFPLVIFIFIVSQFFKYRSSLALLLEYPLVVSRLIKVLKNNPQLSKIFYFSIYETESNFLTKEIYNNTNIGVVKISSDTPLFFWNKFILCDKLLLCNYYQYDEIKSGKIIIKNNNIDFLGPENSHLYKNLYNESSTTPLRSIGFYSTASWVRDKNDSIFQGVDFSKMEKKVLQVLKAVCSNNKTIDLYIKLHPKEKSYKIEYLLNYYKQILGEEVPFKILNYNNSSADIFDKIDLGVSFNSSIIQERLYCGFKSVIFPNNPKFPLNNSPLKNICANSTKEFKNLILESLHLSTYEFFKRHNLFPYSFRKIKL